MKKLIITSSMILTLSFGSVVSGIAEAAAYIKLDGFKGQNIQDRSLTENAILSKSEYLDLAYLVFWMRSITIPEDRKEEIQFQRGSLSQQDFERSGGG